jgi:glucose dehydrogenase
MQTKNMILLGLTLFSFAAVMKSSSFADIDKKPAEVTDARVSADASIGANWMINGRNHDSTHFSPLKQIDDKNVNELGLAWYLDIEGQMGVVSEPIVVDGIALRERTAFQGLCGRRSHGKTSLEI